jgi:superfamily II DNA or RNA helicase
MTTSLLGSDLTQVSPHAFTRLVERLLWHLGYSEVSNIDGTGDGGADIVAQRHGERWVFQAKSKKSKPVDNVAIQEVCKGMKQYNAHHGVVVTNGFFTTNAKKLVTELNNASGVKISLWDRNNLIALYQDDKCRTRFATPNLRRYQVDAFQASINDIRRTGTAFVVLATGLGKTVIAGSVIDRYLTDNPTNKVLVLADKTDLVEQLERAMWRHLPKNVPTQQVGQGEKPHILNGLTIATIQSAITYIRDGFRPDFIFIDEAHHAGDGTNFAQVLMLCPHAVRFGATATPWRGDRFDVAEYFGAPSVKIGIEEGMRLGYLVDVDYRLYVDNINWEFVRDLSANSYSIGDLNRNLFLPQRDERVRDELLTVWMNTLSPRALVFCQTVEHAENMLSVLRAVPAWSMAATIHSKQLKTENRANLAKFRLGEVPVLVAVDVLNEGVDVPDVNIVCFARVTHSRRIFIQQLGRGLRLHEGKSHVTVLDFVSDLKRMKAVLDLKSQVGGERESIMLPSSHAINFNDTKAESLFKEWLCDAASLETAADEVKLNFPPFPEGA